ncbi:5'-3' exoribonuclease [Culex quinquefasciatus]|uniref:5'-3' exoribonuclease n=1 Tax=Culex quinquefasciatus TaxID=7176 RepID=B0XA08_CULQU|nr:5'-3' exoribonuclease [Culex quinquefasciatus]|eukprot:XP_001866480.1 5'-3' exoribonuclease [Culex quinquefasciatus]
MLVGNGWVQWLTCVGGHATDSCFELKLLATCRVSIAGSNGCRRKSMVVQWLKVDGGNLYGRHHVAVWAAQRASYAGASSTIASCGSEGMVWPPTDSRRTLADRHVKCRYYSQDYIRNQRAQPDHDPNTHHVLCDADPIMLGLAMHSTIIREEFLLNKE